MRKWIGPVLVVTLFLAALPALAAPEKPQLTPQQQQEIAPLYQQLFQLRAKIIDKYAEFGVLQPNQAVKAKDRLDRAQENLRKNGYIPVRKHGCKGPQAGSNN